MPVEIPEKLQEIIDDFAISEGREKLELLLQYSESLPPVPPWLSDHDEMEFIPECMTPVYVQAETHAGRLTYHFDVPPESPTVRGLAAIMAEGSQGSSPQQILAIPGDFYIRMGLDQVLTHQRLNGITAILAHMKRIALSAAAESPDE